MTKHIWLDHGIKLYDPEPIKIGGLKCSYCGGILIGSLKHELTETKRQPPVGAVDLQICDEEKKTSESYSCSNCGGDATGYGRIVCPCTGCRREAVRSTAALTWPGLSVQLPVKHDDSDSGSSSLSGCSSCIDCHVCEQPLNSRDIVDARVEITLRSALGMSDDVTVQRHHYSHAQCAGGLIAGITSRHQKTHQNKIAKNKGPKKNPWWKRL